MTLRLLGLFCAGLVLTGGSACTRAGSPRRDPGQHFAQAVIEPGTNFNLFSKVKVYALDPPAEAVGKPEELKRRCALLKVGLEGLMAGNGFEVLPAEAPPDADTLIIRVVVTSWQPAPAWNPFAATRSAIEVRAADTATGSIIAEIADIRSDRDADHLVSAWAADLAAAFSRTAK